MRRSLLTASTALLLATAAQAQVVAPLPAVSGESAAWGGTIARTRQFIRDTMRALGAPGAQITVMKDGVVLWSEGFGWADLEQQVPVTPLTRFRVGSVSKSLTSMALGLLVQEGKLDLDAPVQRYVPAFPRKPWPVTTRQVAGHLAGIRHYNPGEFESRRHYATVTEGLAIFEKDTLLFEPGTRYSYSSYGYNLVSAVLEGASGRPFLALMQERVFGPLGMRQTVAEHVTCCRVFLCAVSLGGEHGDGGQQAHAADEREIEQIMAKRGGGEGNCADLSDHERVGKPHEHLTDEAGHYGNGKRQGASAFDPPAQNVLP